MNWRHPPLRFRSHGGTKRAILPASDSGNHTFPSGPEQIDVGTAGMGNSLIVPDGVTRPRLGAPRAASRNQTFPSAPLVIALRRAFGDGIAISSSNCPDAVMRPIWLAVDSANQRFPSAPAVIPMRPEDEVRGANALNVPDGVTRQILSRSSVNQRFPSGPAVISHGPASPSGMACSFSIEPSTTMTATLRADTSVNHSLPSTPVAIPQG